MPAVVAIEQGGGGLGSPRASQAGGEKVNPATLLGGLWDSSTSYFFQLVDSRIQVNSAQDEQARRNHSGTSFALTAMNHNIFAGGQFRIDLSTVGATSDGEDGTCLSGTEGDANRNPSSLTTSASPARRSLSSSGVRRDSTVFALALFQSRISLSSQSASRGRAARASISGPVIVKPESCQSTAAQRR